MVWGQIASGAIGLGASFLGNSAKKKAAKRAAQAQAMALQEAMNNEQAYNAGALQQIDKGYGIANEQVGQGYSDAFGYMQGGLDTYNQNINPYIQSGNQALGLYGGLAGLGGADAQAQAMAQLENSPYFQSMANSQEKAILQNASATGGLRGGNIQKALASLRPQLLRQEVDRMMGYYGGLMGQGLNATNAQGQLGRQYAQGLSGLATGRGSALGNLALGQMGDINSTNRQTATALQNYIMGKGANEAQYQTTRGGLQAQMWNDVGASLTGGGQGGGGLMGLFGGLLG